MIEIKFCRDQLTRMEKEKYAKILCVVITIICRLNENIRVLEGVVSTETKIIFK